jgi:hypothetical protein
MSRSGYTDADDAGDQWALIRWRGAVASAIKGKRGQAFLRELAAAMDAMPEKRLVAEDLQADGDFCALGVVGHARGLELQKIDTEDWRQLAREFGISAALAREIMYENDAAANSWRLKTVEIVGPVRPFYPDWGSHLTPFSEPDPAAAQRRWRRVRAWVARHIKEASP